MKQLYRENKRLAQDPKHGKRLQDYAEKSFSNSTATLVALLVLNDRKEEAKRVAAEATEEWSDPQFRKQLFDAAQGKVPQPWPGASARSVAT